MVSKNRSTLLRNMRKVSDRKLPQGNGYNCYCFAAYSIGAYDGIHWMGSYEMKGILDQMKKVNEPQPGDIVAIWGDDNCEDGKNEMERLIHTMIYVNKDRYLHKPGHWKLEYASWERVLELYNPGDGFVINKVTYHRI